MNDPAETLWQRFRKPRTLRGQVLATVVVAIVMLPVAWLLLGTIEEALAVVAVGLVLSLVAAAVRAPRG